MKFECRGCGWCCKYFGEHHYLPLYGWEKDILEEEAEKRGVELEFVPVINDMFLDKRSGKAFCFQVGMKNEPCPFLSKENKCEIYDKRPLICRTYPLTHSPLIEESMVDSRIAHCECTDVVKYRNDLLGTKEGVKINVKQSQLMKIYLPLFGYLPLIDATKKALVDAMLGQITSDLHSKKLIKLRKISRFDYSKYKPIPILKFLEERGFAEEGFSENFMNKILGDEEIKEWIDKRSSSSSSE